MYPTGVVSGTKPAGLLLNDVVSLDLTRQHINWFRDEVQVGGNVHFIGTQGVGKSTLLRAILFFYNADTQKLGIENENSIVFEDSVAGIQAANTAKMISIGIGEKEILFERK
jgi:ABC-type phosphate/phosphonate transport system ATPase subunit